MKKSHIFHLLLATVVASCSLYAASCGNEEEDGVSLSVTVANNNQLYNLVEYLKDEFPDVRFDVEYYAGSNSTTYLSWQADKGDVSDIFLGTGVLPRDLQQKALLDLTSYTDITNKFTTSALNSMVVNGHYYMLPCTYQISTYLYNKSLFEEKGWTAPTSHSELVTLVQKIRAEGNGIVPIGVSSYAPGPLFQYLGTFAQANYLTKPSGIIWEDKFFAGEVTAEDGFGDAADMLIELAQAGAFDEEYKDAKEVNLIPNLVQRKVAIIVNSFVDNFAAYETNDEFSSFPFFGKNDEKFISLMPVKALGLSKSLADNPKKLNKALEVMSALCTVEGLDFLKSNDSNIYPLREAPELSQQDILLPLQSYLNAGDCAPPIYTGYEYVSAVCGSAVHKAMFEDGTKEEILTPLNAVHEENTKPVGVIDEDLTLFETVQFGVDFYYEVAVKGEGGTEKLGDFALASVGGRKNGITNDKGVNGKMYRGDVPSPLGEAINLPYNGKLAVLELTGAEVYDMIEHGYTKTLNEVSAQFDYFWSGIEVTFDESGKASIAYNGAPLDRSKTYRVIMVEGDFEGDKNERTGYYEKIVEHAPKNVTEYLVEWLKTNHVKKPAKLCR